MQLASLGQSVKLLILLQFIILCEYLVCICLDLQRAILDNLQVYTSTYAPIPVICISYSVIFFCPNLRVISNDPFSPYQNMLGITMQNESALINEQYLILIKLHQNLNVQQPNFFGLHSVLRSKDYTPLPNKH